MAGDFPAAAATKFTLAPIRIRSATNSFIVTPEHHDKACRRDRPWLRPVYFPNAHTVTTPGGSGRALERQRGRTFNAQWATLVAHLALCNYPRRLQLLCCIRRWLH